MIVTLDQISLPPNALAALKGMQAARRTHALILCFATGMTLPRYCIAMPREPQPPLDVPFDQSFPEILDRVTAANAAVHDGAIILLRRSERDPYLVSGWSYRLTPPFRPDGIAPNRGSAYNSALSMSLTPKVDAVALFSRNGCELYMRGSTFQIA